MPLLRIMAISIPLLVAAEVLRALLDARYSFGAPAAMSAVRTCGAAAVVIVFGGAGIEMVAYAFLFGAGLQLVYLFVVAAHLGYRASERCPIRDPDVLAAGRLTVRPLVAASMNPVARILEQVIVSFLPAGSITLLNYAYRLISAIGGSVFFRSIIVVIVPRLTEQTAAGRTRAVTPRTTRNGLTLMLAVSIPLTAFLALLACGPPPPPSFAAGTSSEADTRVLGLVLAVYALSFIGSGVRPRPSRPVLRPAGHKSPLRNTAYGIAANLVLLPILLFPFATM